MEKKQGGVIDGGAVIIDDGPGKGGESNALLGLLVNLQLTSDDRLEKLADPNYKKHKLDKKPVDLMVYSKSGDSVTFKIEDVVSFHVSTVLEQVDCWLTADSFVIRVSATCMELPTGPVPPKYVYEMPDSGPIKRIEVSFKVGSYVCEGSARLKLEYK